MKTSLSRRDFCTGAAALSLAGFSSTGNARADEVVKVGWPNETEQAILGCMAALILERKLGLKVQRVANLGGTGIAQQTLMSGAIDVLPDGFANGSRLLVDFAEHGVRKRTGGSRQRLGNIVRHQCPAGPAGAGMPLPSFK